MRFKLIMILLYAITSVFAQESEIILLRTNGYYRFVKSNGLKITKPKIYTYAENFSEGLAVVERKMKFGFINTKGKVEIPLEYYDVGSFSEGLAYACINDKYGFINKKGDTVISFKYKNAGSFINGYAYVSISNPDTNIYGKGKYIYGLIDKKGELFASKWFSRNISRIDSSFYITKNDNKYILSINGDLILDTNLINNYKEVDKQPTFKGGMRALMQYLSSNTRYPRSAYKNKIQGRVFAQFVINKKGKVDNVIIVRGVHPLLNKEALRVISSLPDWEPGSNNSENVNVTYTVPINFKLH